MLVCRSAEPTDGSDSPTWISKMQDVPFFMSSFFFSRATACRFLRSLAIIILPIGFGNPGCLVAGTSQDG